MFCVSCCCVVVLFMLFFTKHKGGAAADDQAHTNALEHWAEACLDPSIPLRYDAAGQLHDITVIPANSIRSEFGTIKSTLNWNAPEKTNTEPIAVPRPRLRSSGRPTSGALSRFLKSETSTLPLERRRSIKLRLGQWWCQFSGCTVTRGCFFEKRDFLQHCHCRRPPDWNACHRGDGVRGSF